MRGGTAERHQTGSTMRERDRRNDVNVVFHEKSWASELRRDTGGTSDPPRCSIFPFPCLLERHRFFFINTPPSPLPPTSMSSPDRREQRVRGGCFFPHRSCLWSELIINGKRRFTVCKQHWGNSWNHPELTGTFVGTTGTTWTLCGHL